MKFYKDKICLVTGAASGIGRGVAVELAKAGAYIIMCDIRSDMLGETLALVAAAGGSFSGKRGETHILDVADRDAVFALAEDCATRLGGVDVVLNNAGVAQAAAVQNLSLSDFEWMMNINFWGMVHGSQAFLPQMLAKGSGNIANVSSVFGLFSVPRQAAYNASKFAVAGFTDALRHDMRQVKQNGGAHIGISCIHPGGVNTNIVRHARWEQTADAETERQEAIVNFEKFTMTEPDKAARIILRGIAKNKPRILIGADAVYMDLIKRLLPTKYLRLMPFVGSLED